MDIEWTFIPALHERIDRTDPADPHAHSRSMLYPRPFTAGTTEPRLFGAPIGDFGSAAHRWGRVEIRDLIIAPEREDAGLSAAIKIRESASLDVDGKHVCRFIDIVSAEIGDDPL